MGTLTVGSAADVATFRLEEGRFTFQDIHLNERHGDTVLVNTMTMIDGEIMPIVEEPPLQPWAKLPAHQAGKVIPIRAGLVVRDGWLVAKIG